MNILIVENEIYLAQSIASKLADIGYHCEIAASTKDAIRPEEFDVVLLSPAISGQNFMPVIERYKRSIIILMVSYINNDTVSIPMRMGAVDYIMKPFMIEELIKKITHYMLFEQLKMENISLKRYINGLISDVQTPAVSKKTELPLIAYCSDRRVIDAFAMRLAATKELPLCFVDLATLSSVSEFEEPGSKCMLYAVGFEGLRRADKKLITQAAAGKNILFASTEQPEEHLLGTVELSASERAFYGSEIATMEEYIKSVIVGFQDRYPDVELARKLGISRKSLWEKRKKHGIYKKK